MASADRTRIEDNFSIFSPSIFSLNRKCSIDIKTEVLIVKISLGKIVRMIKNVEFEVTHHIKIANPCYKSKVQHEIKSTLHLETLKEFQPLLQSSPDEGGVAGGDSA